MMSTSHSYGDKPKASCYFYIARSSVDGCILPWGLDLSHGD